MEDVLTAARRFAAATSPEINMVDLGLALVLEYFAWPLLRWVPYTRLAKRNLLPDLETEFKAWLATISDVDQLTHVQALTVWADTVMVHDQADQDHLLALVGRGLYQRSLVRRRANRVSMIVLLAVIMVQVMLGGAIVMSRDPCRLAAGWLCAVALATVVCVTDHHWRLRAGLRRTSG